jgi:DNA damage-binding protein 1
LYRCQVKENDQLLLESLCSYHGYIVAVSVAICGAFIVVGDLMKSVSVLTYDPTQNKINEAYRDYATNYMTCVDAIDEDTFLGADNTNNVFTLKRSENLSNDNNQLEESAQYHLGDMINQFRHGKII